MPFMTAQKLISHEADVGNDRPACFQNLHDLATLACSGLHNPEYPEIARNKALFSVARAIPTCPLPTLLSSCPHPSYLLFQIFKALVCIMPRRKTLKYLRRTRKTPEHPRHQVTVPGPFTSLFHALFFFCLEPPSP